MLNIWATAQTNTIKLLSSLIAFGLMGWWWRR